MTYRISTSNEGVWCTRQLAKFSFNHSVGRTHSWRFSTFYKIRTWYTEVWIFDLKTAVLLCFSNIRLLTCCGVWRGYSRGIAPDAQIWGAELRPIGYTGMYVSQLRSCDLFLHHDFLRREVSNHTTLSTIRNTNIINVQRHKLITAVYLGGHLAVRV